MSIISMSGSELAKYKIIMAAIKLFGELGVNAVSLREINRLAGAKNNSALHYHFKNKHGLVSAVIDFIQTEFNRIRGSDLLKLEQKIHSGKVSINEIMSVFIKAYVVIIENNDWGHDAIKALAKMEFDCDTQTHEKLSRSAGPALRSMFKMLEALLPDIPIKLLKHRVNFSVNAVINGFADHHNLHHSYLGDLSVKNLSQLSDIHCSMTVAVLSAPAAI